MIAYQTVGPNEAGDFLIAYPTPGAPQVLTIAGTASCKRCADAECARLNELQVTPRRAGLVRAANFLPLDLEKER
jgi:hypothetical protein